MLTPSHVWLLRYGSAIGSSLIFSLLALFPIFIKSVWLGKVSGYRALARFLALGNDPKFDALERLSLYREDLLISGIVLPLLILLGLMRIRSHLGRLSLSLAIGIILIIWYYVGLMSLGNTHKFLNLDLLWESLLWGIQNPEIILSYLSPASLLKLGIIVGALLGMSGLLAWLVSRPESDQIRWFRRIWRTWIFSSFGFLILVVVGYSFSFPTRAPYRSIPENMIRAMMVSDLSVGRYRPMNAIQLDHAYRDLTRTPSPAQHSEWFGKEKNSDIILFILETGPEQCVDLAHAAERFPALARIAGRSLFGERHYTTYPYTSAAMYAIFGSIYPNSRRSFLRNLQQASPLGWVHSLKQIGYRFSLYKPSLDSLENDFGMFQNFGADPQFFASKNPDLLKDPQVEAQLMRSFRALNWDQATQQRMLEESARLLHDLVAWQELMRQTRLAQEQGQRFVHAFMPQLGHAPWKEVSKKNQAICERGRDLAAMQFSWLNEWVEALTESGRLEQTILVVTADHGVRTTTEDPALKTGRIDDYTFRVPLMIFLPNTLSRRLDLAVPTSHIDLGPSLQHLLGITPRPEQTHGALLWDPGIQNRTLFFFGKDYFGTDGFYSKNTYISCEYFNESCTTAPTMTIPDDRLYLKDGWTDTQAIGLLRNLYHMENQFMEVATKVQ